MTIKKGFLSGLVKKAAGFLCARPSSGLPREYLEAALEHAEVGISIVSPEGEFLWTNRRFNEIHGYGEDETQRITIGEITHPGDLALVRNKVQGALRGGESRFSIEKRNRCKDGSNIWVRLTSTLLRHADGHPLYFVSVVEDITEQRETALRLKESEAKYRALFDLVPVGMILSDPQGQIVEANPASARLLGISVEKQKQRHLGGTDWRIVRADGSPMPPEDFPSIRALHEHVRIENEEMGVSHPDGGKVWLSVSAMPLPLPGYGSLVAFADITPHRVMESALRESEERYRLLVDQSPDGILIHCQGQIEFANPAAVRLLGAACEEDLMGRAMLDFLHPDFREMVRQRWKILETNDTVPLAEEQHLRMDGSVFDTEAVAVAFTHRGKRMVLVAFRDITQRKRAESELRQLNETLEQRVAEEVTQNREKDHMLIQQSRQAAMGEMIGNIAHQWRQPLNALGLLLANIQDAFAFGELDQETLDKSVADGRRIIRKMSDTIDDFRNFFRPNREKVAFSLDEAVKSAVDLVSASFQQNNVALRFQGDESLRLEGFPNEFSQVVLNLLVNAKEAILAHDRLDGAVDVRAWREDGWACLLVKDNGGGIPPEALPKIFDPYFTTKEAGTGIGLYMSKKILENMDGSLSARNRDGGAEFMLRLPLASSVSAS